MQICSQMRSWNQVKINKLLAEYKVKAPDYTLFVIQDLQFSIQFCVKGNGKGLSVKLSESPGNVHSRDADQKVFMGTTLNNRLFRR